MSEFMLPVTTGRVRGAATGDQNVPVSPEQFDRWMRGVEKAAYERGRDDEREGR